MTRNDTQSNNCFPLCINSLHNRLILLHKVIRKFSLNQVNQGFNFLVLLLLSQEFRFIKIRN